MIDVSRHSPSGLPSYDAQPFDTNRRSFLAFGTGVAGAAAAISVLGAPAAVVDTVEAKSKSRGYRDTEHVRRYYASARL